MSFSAALFLMLAVSGCQFSNSCGDLVYNEALNQCECPEGAEPDTDRQACVSADGRVIPWAGFDVPYPPASDAGTDTWTSPDGGLDMALQDARPDARSEERDMRIDAHPVPTVPLARFPWNGFATGSVHTPDGEPLVNHPLRPKFMWDEIEAADHYQIQLTRECAVEDFHECVFARLDLDETTDETTFYPTSSLTVSRIAPVGSRYYWRVRACSDGGCSEWTEVRYVDVGRDIHDYNGDGYADLLVGEPLYHNELVGQFLLYLGSAAGFPEEFTARTVGEHAMAFFGATLVPAGDINGDGFFDFVVGGSTYYRVYLGSSDLSRPTSSARWLISGNTQQNSEKLARGGDLNGDGFADLIVGEPNVGAVHLFLGNSAGPPSDGRLIPSPMGTGFGAWLESVGDVNGDGYVDFACRTSEGNHVFFGGVDGPMHTLSINGAAAFAQIGDVNGDGYSDLLMNGDRLYQGSRSGPAPTDTTIGLSDAIRPTTLNDTNGDGMDGFAVLDSSTLHVFQGAPAAEPTQSFSTTGRSHVGTGDINGDGYFDYAATTSLGHVEVYLGGPTGFPRTFSLLVEAPLGSTNRVVR